MKYKRTIFLLLILFVSANVISEEIRSISDFYEHLSDLKNIEQPGYKMNGEAINYRVQYTGNSTDFYVEPSNLFLKVFDIKTKNIFYTKCFSFSKSSDNFLCIDSNEQFRVLPFIQLGHQWKMTTKKGIILVQSQLQNEYEIISLYTLPDNVSTDDFILYRYDSSCIETQSYQAFQNYIQLPSFNFLDLNMELISYLIKFDKDKNSKKYTQMIDSYYKCLKSSTSGVDFLTKICHPKPVDIDSFSLYLLKESNP